METKLTLRIDNALINSAKRYAKHQRLSLSRLIATYLRSLTTHKTRAPISPVVHELTGIVPKSADIESILEGRGTYLSHKHK